MKRHMPPLEGYQKRYLRGLAHALKPTVFVGQKGLTDALIEALNEALDHHELVKVKFVDCKDRQKKSAMIDQIQKSATCDLVSVIGHMATFFRHQPDPQKRKIEVPRRTSS